MQKLTVNFTKISRNIFGVFRDSHKSYLKNADDELEVSNNLTDLGFFPRKLNSHIIQGNNLNSHQSFKKCS